MDNITNSTELVESYRQSLNKKLKDGSVELPIMPKVATTIFSMLRNPNVGIDQLSKLIQHDQSLVAHVLKTANSAAFAASIRIESISQAVARIGTKLLGDIAFSVTLQGKFYKVPGYEGEVKLLLKQSLTSAIFGQMVSPICNINSEIQYLCCLMHNIGKPITLQFIANINKDMAITLPFDQAKELIAEYYVELGTLLAMKWDMPDFIVTTIQHHNDYTQAPDYKNETALCDLSDKLSDWALGLIDDDIDALKSYNHFKYLNYSDSQVEKILEMKEKVIERATSMEL